MTATVFSKLWINMNGSIFHLQLTSLSVFTNAIYIGNVTPPPLLHHIFQRGFIILFLSFFNQHSPKPGSHSLNFFPSSPTLNEQLQAKQIQLFLNQSTETFDMRGNLFVHESYKWRPITEANMEKSIDRIMNKVFYHFSLSQMWSCHHLNPS